MTINSTPMGLRRRFFLGTGWVTRLPLQILLGLFPADIPYYRVD